MSDISKISIDGVTHSIKDETARNQAPIFKRVLTSDDDLNNITEPGIYRYSTSSVPKNCPYENAGTVEVIYAGSTSGIKQVVTRYGLAGESQFRISYSGTWLDWKRYTVESYLEMFSSHKMEGVTHEYAWKNVIICEGTQIRPKDFPNTSFLITLTSEYSPDAVGVYIVVTGASDSTTSTIVPISQVTDNPPIIKITTSGYLYAVWTKSRNSDIRASVFKLA